MIEVAHIKRLAEGCAQDGSGMQAFADLVNSLLLPNRPLILGFHTLSTGRPLMDLGISNHFWQAIGVSPGHIILVLRSHSMLLHIAVCLSSFNHMGSLEFSHFFSSPPMFWWFLLSECNITYAHTFFHHQDWLWSHNSSFCLSLSLVLSIKFPIALMCVCSYSFRVAISVLLIVLHEDLHCFYNKCKHLILQALLHKKYFSQVEIALVVRGDST